MKIEITKAQLKALIDMMGDCEALSGGGADTDNEWEKRLRLIDRMLAKNNLSRNFVILKPPKD